MVSSSTEAIGTGLTREQIVPSRRVIKLPPWLEVAKPRLIPLLLATTIGGMALSEGWPVPSLRMLCTLGGGALAAAAAGALNCLWEQDLDGRMKRTSGRALPSGRLSSNSVLIGAITSAVLGSILLIGGVNCLAAGLSLFGLCSYVLLYTAFLKPRTSQNIVIGGIAGAIPPLVGAAAATGYVGLSGWWLFFLVMLWTPAHFWALAIFLKDDYQSVGIPMLPVVKGTETTARAISYYAWATVAFSFLGILALPEGGILYGVLLVPLNLRFLQIVNRLGDFPQDVDRAKGLFKWSILYMFGVCFLLVISRTELGALFDSQGTFVISQLSNYWLPT